MRRTMKARPGVMLAAALALSAVALAQAGAPQQQQQQQQQQTPPQQQQQTPPQHPAPPAGGAAGGGQRAPEGQAAAPQKPLEPVAASTLANSPDRYYGNRVTMTAAVEQVLGPTAFSVDQDKTKSTGKEVLVLTPALYGKVEANTYVTVIGDVIKFDPDEVAKKAPNLKIDLPADAVAKYRGKPAVLATGVINGAFVDLTKRLPPPMTADDEALSKVMKKVGPAFAALRTAVDGSKAEPAAENATKLKEAFTETEAFWKAKGKPDATTLAAGAKKSAELIERGVATGKWDDVKASAGTLGQSCQSCHSTYRERFDDGSFRIKGLTPAKSGS